MIKAVIFDWGGVLIKNPEKGLILFCANSLGVSEKLFISAYKKFKDDFQKGTIPEDAFWDKICGELKIQKPNTYSLWGEAFRHAYSPKEEMFSLAAKLRNQGYKIGFLSNTEAPAMKYFHEKRYGMFDAAIFSCAEGTIKPERKIYETALNKLGVKPHEAIFIDDKKKYLEGAKKLGINTILFISPDQVKKKLSSFPQELQKSK